MSSTCITGGTYSTLPPVWDAKQYDVERQSGFPTFPMVSMYRHYDPQAGDHAYVVWVATLGMDGVWYGCPTRMQVDEAYEMACDRYLPG